MIRRFRIGNICRGGEMIHGIRDQKFRSRAVTICPVCPCPG